MSVRESSGLLHRVTERGSSDMFGHDRESAARRFDGAVTFIPGARETASLDLAVHAESLVLLGRDVTERDRLIDSVPRLRGETDLRGPSRADAPERDK